MKETEELLLLNIKRKLRKLGVDEAILYDKYCPKCKKFSLIFTWNWLLKCYENKGRCSNPNCAYGN